MTACSKVCLDRELIYMLSEVMVVINDWVHYHSNVRLHRSLRLLPRNTYTTSQSCQASFTALWAPVTEAQASETSHLSSNLREPTKEWVVKFEIYSQELAVDSKNRQKGILKLKRLTFMDAEKIIELIASFIGGATLSGLITFKFTKKLYSKNTNTMVTQSGNTAGRDIVGGDKSAH